MCVRAHACVRAYKFWEYVLKEWVKEDNGYDWLLLVVIGCYCGWVYTRARAYVRTEMRMVYFSRRIRWVTVTLL